MSISVRCRDVHMMEQNVSQTKRTVVTRLNKKAANIIAAFVIFSGCNGLIRSLFQSNLKPVDRLDRQS